VSRHARLLAAGDVSALLAFAVLGLLSHDGEVTVAGLARDFVPVAAGFGAAAALFPTYRRPGLRTLLPAWAVGVTAGVVVRGLALGREPSGSQLAFLAVTLVVTLVLLLAWRGLESIVARRRRVDTGR
jgi:peptidoglycan/LPS O-acetylase OafA/YrhL